MIAQRAMQAAGVINRQRGWEQPEEIHERRNSEIAKVCMEVLRSMPRFSWADYEAGLKAHGYDIRLQRDSTGQVRGYSVLVGNSVYKSSRLGSGRHLMPSHIEATWARLHNERKGTSISSRQTNEEVQTSRHHQGETRAVASPSPVMEEQRQAHYQISTDEYHHYDVAIPETADAIIRKECTLPEDNPFVSIEDIQKTALLLFAGYIDGATSMVASGGGGGSDMSGWGRDKDEDDRDWARRCARMANSMCRRRRGLHR